MWPLIQNSDEKSIRLAEFSFVAEQCEYRNRLIVTEFTLVSTAAGISANAAIQTSSVIFYILILYVSFVFISIGAYHMWRVNHDRLRADKRLTEILVELNMYIVHADAAGERKLFPATKMMVIFSIAVSGFAFIISAIESYRSYADFCSELKNLFG